MRGKRGEKLINVTVGLVAMTVISFFLTLPAARADITNGLVGWWRLDDGAGLTAVDSGTSGTNGSLQNSPTWISGRRGSALDFDGATQYVDITYTDFDFDEADPFSISGWIKRDTNNTIDSVVGRSSAVNNYQGYAFYAGSGSGSYAANAMVFIIANTLTGGVRNAIVVETPAGSLTAGAWHHVVSTYDGSGASGGVHIYIDGVDQAPLTILFAASAVTGTTKNTQNLRIGEDQDGDFMDGSLDDIRIYNRVLSPAEVTGMYNLSNTSRLGGMHMGGGRIN